MFPRAFVSASPSSGGRSRQLVSVILACCVSMPLMANDRELPSDKYEQPRHKVLEQVGNIEIREYAPMLMAEVDVTGDRGQAARDGFRILARYIFGGNRGQQSIAMTSPVIQVDRSSSKSGEQIAMTSPVTQVERSAAPRGEQVAMTSPVTQVPSAASDAAGEQRWTFAFIMPSKYTLETLPKPETDRIRFRMAPPEKRVAIRFSGFSTQSNLDKHRAELEAFIASRQLKTVGVPVMAFYDDPFTLPWNRRNEWWVALAP
ncbi:MAG: SOUL family heme-binding protein [Burkholderiales bacterium]|jgi:hypothetical protein